MPQTTEYLQGLVAQRREAIRRLRQGGMTWEKIGGLFDFTRQAAQQAAQRRYLRPGRPSKDGKTK